MGWGGGSVEDSRCRGRRRKRGFWSRVLISPLNLYSPILMMN